MFRANLQQPEIDYATRRVIARLEIVEGNFLEFFDQADKSKEFDVEIKRHRARRSLDSNSYFHVLVGKIANALGTSAAEIKNLMIASYGQAETDEDGRTQFLIVRDGTPVEKWTEIHLQPTSQTKELNGVMYRVYIVMRGSHTYNTKEMADLIDGTISEAKEAGIPEAEIVSTREAKMLREVYGIEVTR